MRRIGDLIPMLALSGCLAAGALEDVTEPPQDKPLVTGSVRVIENGIAMKWPANYLAGTHFWLLVLAKGARRAVSYRLGPEAEFVQHPHAVGANLETGADFGELGRLLVNIDVEAALQQRQRPGQPADSGSGDQEAQ